MARVSAVRQTTASCNHLVYCNFLNTTTADDTKMTVRGVTGSPQQLAYLYNYVPPSAGYDNTQPVTTSNYPANSLFATVGIPGAPQTPCPTNFTISAHESAPMEWSLPFQSPYAAQSPYSQRTAWQGIMGIYKPMTFTATWGDQAYAFQGLSIENDMDRTGQRPLSDIEWKGQDYSQLLFITDVSMPAVRNRLASYVVAEILAFCKVPQWNLAQLIADDWVIPYMLRLKGRPIDWIMQILDVPVLEWKFVNGYIFTPYLPNAQATTATWVYPAGSVIRKASEKVCGQPIINQVITRIVREVTQTVQPSSMTRMKAAATTTPPVPTLQPTEIMQLNVNSPAVEASTYGNYSANFSPPVNDVKWKILAASGGIWSDFEFKNAGGVITAVREPRAPTSIPQSSIGFSFNITPGGNEALYPPQLLLNGITNCSSVSVTFGEAPSDFAIPGVNLGIPGYGKIEFSGTRPTAVPIPQKTAVPETGVPKKTAPYDPILGVIVNDYVSQTFAGRVYCLDESPNSLIDNSITARLHATRKLMRTSRQMRESSWILPLNGDIERGDVVFVEDVQLGSFRVLLVVGFEHVYSTTPQQRGSTIHCREFFYMPANALAGAGTPQPIQMWGLSHYPGQPTERFSAIGYASGQQVGTVLPPLPQFSVSF